MPSAASHATAPKGKAPAKPVWRLGYKLLLAVAVAAILLAVFSLYAQPEFLMTLADQLWACF